MKKIWLFLLGFILCLNFTKAGYSDEFSEAYTWAYSNSITTQPTIETANMYGEITRIELSKMISNYAINVLNKKVDTSKKCEFDDISDKLNKQYDSGVTKSCQLGLMGQGITDFRPTSKVTRAEFGTILSRLLYGDKYNGGNPYYKKHINQLNIRGIMTNISNPEKGKEIRGNVMVMLKRSENLGNLEIPSFEELIVNDDNLECNRYYKTSFILPYKDGYIGYNFDGQEGRLLSLTYSKNPYELVSISDSIFWWNGQGLDGAKWPITNIYEAIGVIDSGPTEKIVKKLNCDKGNKCECIQELNQYIYNLMIGEEEQEYFTQRMNKFKKDINNNIYTSYEFWHNRRKICFDKAIKKVDNSGIVDGNLREQLRNEEIHKCAIEYLKD